MRLQLRERRLDVLDHADSVLAGLTAHVHHDGALTIEERRGAGILLGVLDRRDVRHANGGAPPGLATTIWPNSLTRSNRRGAQHHLGISLVDAAAGDLDVVGSDGVAHLSGGEALRGELLHVDLDVLRGIVPRRR